MTALATIADKLRADVLRLPVAHQLDMLEAITAANNDLDAAYALGDAVNAMREELRELDAAENGVAYLQSERSRYS